MKGVSLLSVITIFASYLAILHQLEASPGNQKWDSGKGKLGLCFGSHAHDRQLRSENLNHYLIEMAKCVASSGRPRFGKRSEVEMDTPSTMSDEIVGPKDTKWLRYYLGLPESTMVRRLAEGWLACRLKHRSAAEMDKLPFA